MSSNNSFLGDELTTEELLLGLILPIVAFIFCCLLLCYIIYLIKEYKRKKKEYEDLMMTDLITPDDINVVVDVKNDEIKVELPFAVLAVVDPSSTNPAYNSRTNSMTSSKQSESTAKNNIIESDDETSSEES